MEVFFIILSALLALILGATVYYLLTVVRKLLFVSSNITGFHEELLEYKNHLSYVRKLPLYYDDPVLKELFNHTDYMSISIDRFGAVMYLLPEDQREKIVGEMEDEERGLDEEESGATEEDKREQDEV